MLCILPFLVPPSTIEERQSNKTQLGFSHTAVQYTSECERTVDINGADTKWENSVQWNFRAGCLPLTSIQPRLSSPPRAPSSLVTLLFSRLLFSLLFDATGSRNPFYCSRVKLHCNIFLGILILTFWNTE